MVAARPLVDITRDAMDILCRELGPVEAARFINQFTLGFGNYTEERRQIYANMTLDDILAEMKGDTAPQTHK